MRKNNLILFFVFVKREPLLLPKNSSFDNVLKFLLVRFI